MMTICLERIASVWQIYLIPHDAKEALHLTIAVHQLEKRLDIIKRLKILKLSGMIHDAASSVQAKINQTTTATIHELQGQAIDNALLNSIQFYPSPLIRTL